MQLFAHVTAVELPMVAIALLAGVAIGLGIAFFARKTR